MSKLPKSFLQSLKGVEGFNEAQFVAVHESGEQVTSIRINPLKNKSVGELNNEVVNQQTISNDPSINLYDTTLEQVPWCTTGRYLPQRPSFTFDPAFHAGAYYVQEASSMFLDAIFNQIFTSSPSRILDLCAAPGGKSTLIAGRFPESFIVSNEVIKTRVTILAENISKWGSSNVVVSHNEPKDFKKLEGFFDLLVIDAPCSGSGLFRKDVDAIEEWSEANVEMCTLRQQRILQDAISCLKTNGYLVYSTCSYSTSEDEDVCDWIVNTLQLEALKINVDPAWGIVETFSTEHKVPGYRFYPDKLKGEGFFVACFKQTNLVDEYYNVHGNLASINKTELEIISRFIRNISDYHFFKQKETIIAYPAKFSEDVATVQNILNIRKSGVAIGTIKGKDLVPHHELALSNIVSENIPVINVDYNNAIKYLKRADLDVEIKGKGWSLIQYKGYNLGWVKVLPNRLNNYYPTEWRILKH